MTIIIGKNVVSPNKWSGKTWNILGDSFSERNIYPPLVQAALGIKRVNNYGVSGLMITKHATNITNPLSVTYANMDQSADLIMVWAGINDFGYNFGSYGGNALGVMGDLTINTFYGAMDVLIKGLHSRFPGKKICFISPTRISNTKVGTESYEGGDKVNTLGFTLIQYVNAMKETCEKYSVPYLDLYNQGGINQLNKATLLEDGLHPNVAGFTFLATKIAAFFKGL